MVNLTLEKQNLLRQKHGLTILKLGDQELTENFEVELPCKVSKLCAGKIKIGAYSYFLTDRIHKNTEVEIGRYCSISENVVFGLASHPTNWLAVSEFQWVKNFMKSGNIPTLAFCAGSRKVTIGNDVWIGDSVLIKGGVKIGDGAIVGAGAVVTKDVPPYAIVVGVPAKVIRFRNSEDTIKKLLKLQWWTLKPDQMNGVAFDDVDEAIEEIYRVREFEKESPQNFVKALDVVRSAEAELIRKEQEEAERKRQQRTIKARLKRLFRGKK